MTKATLEIARRLARGNALVVVAHGYEWRTRDHARSLGAEDRTRVRVALQEGAIRYATSGPYLVLTEAGRAVAA